MLPLKEWPWPPQEGPPSGEAEGPPFGEAGGPPFGEAGGPPSGEAGSPRTQTSLQGRYHHHLKTNQLKIKKIFQ